MTRPPHVEIVTDGLRAWRKGPALADQLGVQVQVAAPALTSEAEAFLCP